MGTQSSRLQASRPEDSIDDRSSDDDLPPATEARGEDRALVNWVIAAIVVAAVIAVVVVVRVGR